MSAESKQFDLEIERQKALQESESNDFDTRYSAQVKLLDLDKQLWELKQQKEEDEREKKERMWQHAADSVDAAANELDRAANKAKAAFERRVGDKLKTPEERRSERDSQRRRERAEREVHAEDKDAADRKARGAITSEEERAKRAEGENRFASDDLKEARKKGPFENNKTAALGDGAPAAKGESLGQYFDTANEYLKSIDAKLGNSI
jgi:hypothetical protein